MRGRANKAVAVLLTVGMCMNGLPVSAALVSENSGGVLKEGRTADEALVLNLDMESLTDNKVINKVDGTDYKVEGSSPLLTEGKSGHGSALKFNGSNYINIGTAIQPKDEYTFMGWVKQDAGGKATQALISRGVSGSVDDQWATLLKSGQIYHCVATSRGNTNTNYNEFIGGTVPSGAWSHIAVTRSKSQLLYYVNGNLAYTATGMPESDFASSALNTYIGMDEGSGGLWNEHQYTGLMDDIRIYKKSLTIDEIKNAAGITDPCKLTVAENGRLVVRFENPLEQEPVQEEFSLAFQMDGKEIYPEITEYSYDTESGEAVFGFTPIENHFSVEKEVQVSVSYDTNLVEGSFILPAGDNQSPVVTDVHQTNLSTRLGDEPCVKGMLKANYTFEDPDGDSEGETKYQWYSSDSKDGSYEKLQGINTQTVILLDEYAGSYLKCEVKAADEYGNQAASQLSSPIGPIQETQGNPLTDWFLNAQFGVSHHLLSEFVNLDFVSTQPGEKWDSSKQSWNDFIGEFDAEKYAAQISQTGAGYVIITLGQNAAEYCAPNLAYDNLLREAGLLKEGESNPKTVSFENDLPMKMADALAPYGIKVMLYLPSNVPHSAHWNPGDFQITEKALKGRRYSNGPNSQEAKKNLCEMVEWWSNHYGDKIAGWWFDGMYPGGTLESQNDMSLEYNVSTLANAAKAGNPYNIISFNQGTGTNWIYGKNTPYHDFTAGECNNFNLFPTTGRWAPNTTDCQNFLFGFIGTGGWGWGAAGISRTDEYMKTQADQAIAKSYVLGFDTKVNHFGNVDPDQLAQLIRLKESLPTISSLEEMQIETTVGNAPVMPETTEAEFSDGSKKQVNIIWEPLNEEDYQQEGTYQVMGAVAATQIKAVCTIEVKDPKSLLRKLYDQCEGIEKGDYSDATWQKFVEARDAAAEVLSDPTAVPADIHEKWLALFVAKTNLEEGVNKELLIYAIELGTNVDIQKATPASIQRLKDALDAGRTLLDTEVTEEQVKQAVRDIMEAIQNLQDMADKQWLRDLVDTIGKLTEENYTPSTWSALMAEKTNAERILLDDEATQEQVDAEYRLLAEKMMALKDRANRKGLETAIELAEEILAEKDRYVASTIKGLAEVLNRSKVVCENLEAEQAEVDTMARELLEAVSKARVKADKKTLRAAILRAEGVETARYTDDSVKDLKKALEKANQMLGDENLSEDDQKKVDAIAADLVKAIDGLKLKAEPGNPSGGNQKPSGKPGNSPKTGDESLPFLWMGIVVLAGVSGLTFAKKKREREM